MKRILVPTDFSEQAENALKVAVQIAKKFDGEIFLINSIELPLHLATASSTGDLPAPLFYMKLVNKRFEELRQKDFLEGVVVHESIGRNEIYEDIEEACKRENIDLIVMGSRGASGFREMFIGSNTEKVVRTSSIPVLVIKNNKTDVAIEDFVFASDFSKTGKNAFQKALNFAQKIDAKMHLLLVNTPANFKTSAESYKQMENFVGNTSRDNLSFNIYNDISVEKGILNFASHINAQLIGMGTHGRKGISHFFNGSISEDMVNHADMPIITFAI